MIKFSQIRDRLKKSNRQKISMSEPVINYQLAQIKDNNFNSNRKYNVEMVNLKNINILMNDNLTFYRTLLACPIEFHFWISNTVNLRNSNGFVMSELLMVYIKNRILSSKLSPKILNDLEFGLLFIITNPNLNIFLNKNQSRRELSFYHGAHIYDYYNNMGNNFFISSYDGALSNINQSYGMLVSFGVKPKDDYSYADFNDVSLWINIPSNNFDAHINDWDNIFYNNTHDNYRYALDDYFGNFNGSFFDPAELG